MKVVDKRVDKYSIYIGRGSVFGNPFRVDMYGRDKSIDMYEKYARNDYNLLIAIKNLKEDDVLGCYCAPKKCHGDVIIKLWKIMNKVKK